MNAYCEIPITWCKMPIRSYSYGRWSTIYTAEIKLRKKTILKLHTCRSFENMFAVFALLITRDGTNQNLKDSIEQKTGSHSTSFISFKYWSSFQIRVMFVSASNMFHYFNKIINLLRELILFYRLLRWRLECTKFKPYLSQKMIMGELQMNRLDIIF